MMILIKHFVWKLLLFSFGLQMIIVLYENVVYLPPPQIGDDKQDPMLMISLPAAGATSAAASFSSSTNSSSSSSIISGTDDTDTDADDNSELVTGTTTTTTTSDRYKATTTTYRLPVKSGSNNDDNNNHNNNIEQMVRNHYERDKTWYDACAYDNATSWTANVRQRGGISNKHFHRACPNTGLHPQGVHYNPFQTRDHNCDITSRINLQVHRDHFYDSWSIQTFGYHNNNNNGTTTPKTVGGDTFYVVYSEYNSNINNSNNNNDNSILLPTAVAIQTDYYNGTYGLNFVSVPFMNNKSVQQQSKQQSKQRQGRITIYAITTCFIGELYPPLKDGWNTGGQTNVSWTIDNIGRPYKIEDWYIDRYYPTTTTTSQSKNNNNLKEFDRTVFFGDSILRQMIWDIGQKDYHQTDDLIQSGKIWVAPAAAAAITTEEDASNGDGGLGGVVMPSSDKDKDSGPVNVNMPLSPATLQDYIRVMDASIRDGLLLINNDDDDAATNNNTTTTTTTTIGNNNNNNSITTTSSSTTTNTPSNITLVLGSAAWDVIWPAEWQGPNFDSHLAAVRDLIRYVRTTYPHVTVLWKLPYANHMQAADPHNCFTNPLHASDHGSCVTALRYATLERFAHLYKAQKYMLTEDPEYKDEFRNSNNNNDNNNDNNRVRVLDLYEVSYLSGAHWMNPADSLHYSPEWNRRILELLFQ